MATYLQGITDYIPQLQPFQPDYNFLANVLQTKQTRYDAAHKQLSSLYGTMLNSPMLREQNIEKRNEFFRSIDENIKRLSGVDLSLQQNVDQASEMFKGLYEDKNIVKDMTWTKNWMNQREKGKLLKTCPDPDKCGGQWWEGGDKYLDYKAQEFKSASDDEALGFQDVEYIAAQNFTEKALKAAKESGLSVKWDEVKGDWIVHHKNGKQLVPSLSEFFISKFGNDGNMMAFMKAQSYLKRKDWVAQNVANYNNNEMEANVGYLNTVFNSGMNDLNKDKKEADEKHELADNQSKNIDKYIEKNGYTDAQDWLSDWTAAKDQTAVTAQVKQTYDNAVNNANLTKYNKDNIKLYLDQMDNVMAMSMLKSYSKNAAEEYAYGTEEKINEANPFAIQAKNHAFQAQQARERQGYMYRDPQTGEMKYQPGTSFFEKKALKELEWQHADEVNTAALERNIPGGGKEEADVEASKNSATRIIDKDLAVKENEKKATDALVKSGDAKKNLVTTMLDAAIAANRKEQMAAGSGTKLLDLKPFLNDIGISGALASKYKIDYIKVLKGDQAEYDKYVSLLSSNSDLLDKAYNSSVKYGNPADSVGALAYDNGWTADKGVQEKFSAYRKEAKKYDEDYNWMLNYNQKGTDDARKIFNAEMKEKRNNAGFQAFDSMFEKTIDPSTKMVVNLPGSHIQSSLSGILKQNLDKTGFKINSGSDFKLVPKDYRLKMVHEAAVKWAEANKSRFKPEAVAGSPKIGEGGIGESFFPEAAIGTEGTTSYTKSSFQSAYEFAVKAYSDLKPKYEGAYRENVPAWNGTAAQSGNAKFSVASRGYVDAIGGDKTEVNKTLFDLYDNYSKLKSSGDAIVVTGNDFSEKNLKRGNKKWAAEILEGYMAAMREGSDIDKKGRPKDENRARAEFVWTKIAAASPDWIGFRLDFAPQWVEKNTSSDKKTRLIPNDAEKLASIQDGIVVFMKKNKVTGDFMTKSEYTIDDARMEQDKYITVQNKAGSATLRRNPAGYYEISTLLNTVDGNGNIQAIGSTEAVDQSFDPATFRQMFTDNLDWLEYTNQHALGDYAAQYGKKNPQEVFGK